MILPGLLLAYDWIFRSSLRWPSDDARPKSANTTAHSEPFAVILSEAKDLALGAQGKLREESRSGLFSRHCEIPRRLRLQAHGYSSE